MSKYTTESDVASTVYHPQQALALQRLIKELEGVIASAREALVQNPPPFVAGPPVSTVTQHGTVANDFAEVYATPHVNAQVIGKVAQGGVLPLVADASTDEHYTWWKITDGQFKDGYVKGRSITMQ